MIISATRHDDMHQPPAGSPCWHDIATAARALGRSELAVRRAVRRVGVKKVSGPAVAGMVELWLEDAHSVTSGGYLPFFDGVDPKTGR